MRRSLEGLAKKQTPEMTITSLDEKSSTTRLLTRVEPSSLRNLPPKKSKRGEGGLRMRGYYKLSWDRRPLVSVIQPVLNADRWLENSIKSVLYQSYDNLEYIIIDGGSSDRTLGIIGEHEDFIDYWVSEDDKGIFDAMNKGVGIASGDWLYFLGADDILVNNLHRIVPHLRNRKRIYYGDVYWPNQNRVYDGEFTWHKLIVKNICHQAMFYPREVFDQNSFPLQYRVCGDYALNMELWAAGKFKFKYFPFLVCIFNDAGTCCTHRDVEFEKDKANLVKRHFSRQIYYHETYQRLRNPFVRFLEMFGLKERLRHAVGGKRIA